MNHLNKLSSLLESFGFTSEAERIIKLSYREVNLSSGNNFYVIVSGDTLYKIDDFTDEEALNTIAEDLDLDLSYADIYEPYDLISKIRNKNSVSTLIGEVSGNVLSILNDSSFGLNAYSSKLVKKVMKYLGIKYVSQEYGSGTFDYPPEPNSRPAKPKNLTWLHGTSSMRLPGLLRYGLQSPRGKSLRDEMVLGLPVSQFEKNNIVHEDVIFLTSSMEKAIWHARNATINDGGFPVVLRLKLPDPNKIIPDFDVLPGHNNEEEEYYPHIDASRSHNALTGLKDDATKSSIEVGVIGYRSNRIPASFFEGIYVIDGNEELGDVTPMKISEVIQIVNKLVELDMLEFVSAEIFTDRYMLDELLYEEEEDEDEDEY